MNWRTDWFAEVGVKKFPETWEELYEVGKKLKAKDHPFGFELGHGFGDNHGWLYPLLWSYGGHEVEADGKTVVIDSDETARAVDFARKFFKDTMLDDVLGWTDVSNNKAYFAEQISCTNNAESILWLAKRDFPEIAKVTDQAQNPAGPKGRFHLMNSVCHSIFNFTPAKDEARAFLRWLMDEKQLGAWYASADSYYQPLLHGYDNAPMWQVEPRNIPYRDALASAHLPGWPAPPNRAAGRKPRQIRRRRHVRQGLRRRLDQRGDQERRRAAEGDLPAGVICGRPLPRPSPQAGEGRNPSPRLRGEGGARASGRVRGTGRRGNGDTALGAAGRGSPACAARRLSQLARPGERVQLADDGAAAAVSGGAGRLSVLLRRSC